MEYKLPEGFSDRSEAIEALLKNGIESAASDLLMVKHIVGSFLLKSKGYSVNDIEIDREFDVTVNDEKARSKADFVISIGGRRLVSIKCSADALVSRERHALACARLIESYQIPFSVITDGTGAIVLDTVSGNVAGEGMEAIPSRQQLADILPRMEFRELPPGRVEKEKRIVQAFDVTEFSAGL